MKPPRIYTRGILYFFGEIRRSTLLRSWRFGGSVMRNHPRAYAEIHRILKLEGVVYITVPNTRSFNFWLFNKNWYGLDAPRHVISYCPKALKYLCGATGFEVVNISFRSGAFNFVRSVKYFLDEDGKHWPAWMRRIDWPRNKPIRRILKPFFLLADLGQVGDVIVGTLKKTSQ